MGDFLALRRRDIFELDDAELLVDEGMDARHDEGAVVLRREIFLRYVAVPRVRATELRGRCDMLSMLSQRGETVQTPALQGNLAFPVFP